MDGTVFSIEEFATFDGPGIRMTVFLKGCPLRCSWCHNPEGQNPQIEYIRSPNGCTHCNRCLEAGKHINGSFILTKESVSACPRNLVRACGEAYSSDRLCEIILKNAVILNKNGGGVTFSGGEPLMQSEFLLECCEKLKQKVHIAIQTAGFAKEEDFARVLKVADYFLYDIKLIDSAKHAHYVGAPNETILRNYESLVRSGVPFITRTPLIPGVTDTEENLRGIASYLHSLGVKEIELLPYNQYAGSKYSWLARDYRPDFDPDALYQYRPEIFADYKIKATLK